MTEPDSRRPLFSGFVPLTALARVGSVLLVVLLLAGFWHRQGSGWGLGLIALGAVAGFGLGALYNPIRVGLSGQADPLTDPRLRRGASWAGGSSGLMLVAGLSALLLVLSRDETGAVDLIRTVSVALNAGYLPAKLACLAHGCCRAGVDAPAWLRRMPGDLRGFELAATGLVLAFVFALPAEGPWPTLAGLAGHFAIRLVALRVRGFAIGPARLLADPGIELTALAALMALTVLIG